VAELILDLKFYTINGLLVLALTSDDRSLGLKKRCFFLPLLWFTKAACNCDWHNKSSFLPFLHIRTLRCNHTLDNGKGANSQTYSNSHTLDIWKPKSKHANALEVSYNWRDAKWVYFPNPHPYSTRPVHTSSYRYIQLMTIGFSFSLYTDWFHAMNS
jgi:hypothetical protein